MDSPRVVTGGQLPDVGGPLLPWRALTRIVIITCQSVTALYLPERVAYIRFGMIAATAQGQDGIRSKRYAMHSPPFLLSPGRVGHHLGHVESQTAEKLLHDVGNSLDPHHIDGAERLRIQRHHGRDQAAHPKRQHLHGPLDRARLLSAICCPARKP